VISCVASVFLVIYGRAKRTSEPKKRRHAINGSRGGDGRVFREERAPLVPGANYYDEIINHLRRATMEANQTTDATAAQLSDSPSDK